MFKMTTGGDMISAEEKFGGIINFVNHAKYVFACNKVPDAKDDADAYFRRWIIINFPNRFEGAKDDKKMIDKIITDEELSGLLNKALDALGGLMEHGDFSNVQTVEEMRDRYTRLASPVKSFIKDRIEEGSDYWVATEDLFIAFKQYCTDKNYPSMSKEGFMKKLKSEIVNMRAEKETIYGQRVHGLRGIRLTNDEEPFVKEVE
jgi:putative DNA primase/helicase